MTKATGIGRGGVNAAKTHCPKGHEYSGENLILSKSGRRWCRSCLRDRRVLTLEKRRASIYAWRRSPSGREATARYRERHRAEIRASGRKYRQARLDLLRVLKDNPCTDCGGRFAPYVMDFDHREGETKLGHISTLISLVSREQLRVEITKCDLVCANCHRIRTQRRIEARLGR